MSLLPENLDDEQRINLGVVFASPSAHPTSIGHVRAADEIATAYRPGCRPVEPPRSHFKTRGGLRMCLKSGRSPSPQIASPGRLPMPASDGSSFMCFCPTPLFTAGQGCNPALPHWHSFRQICCIYIAIRVCPSKNCGSANRGFPPPGCISKSVRRCRSVS